MGFLPSLAEPIGPYTVGATTFVRSIPEQDQVVVGTGHVRSETNSQETRPALKLEEIAFTAFYPAEIHNANSWTSRLWGHHRTRKGIPWMVEPAAEALKGYEHWSGKHFPGGAGSKLAAMIRYIITWWSSSVTIPVYPNAPLLKPTSSNPHGWPLVIFSHGLAGTRNTYSTLCTHLAAQGRIVISMEHRDGTGPVVLPRGKVLYYVAPDDVRRPEDTTQVPLERSAYNSEKALRFRNEQLDFRRREVYETIRSITALNSADQLESGLQVMDGHEYDNSHWAGHVDVNHIDLVGHSFGGATVLSLLSNAPSPMMNGEKQYPRIPVRQVLLLDPWMEPFSGIGPKPYTTDLDNDATSSRTDSQFFVINSEYFTSWTAHFEDAQKAVAAFTPSRIITLLTAEHMAFSDICMLVPRRLQSVDGPELLRTICQLSDQFLKRELGMEGDLRAKDVVVKNCQVEAHDKEGRAKSVGEEGEIVVH